MNNKFWILILFFLFHHDLVVSQVPEIFGIAKKNEDTNSVISFDYISQESEIIFDISPRIRPGNLCTAFDPFRKIFYYMTISGPCGGPYKKTFYAVDLKDHSRKELFIINEDVSILDLQYDFFSNSLVIREPDSLKFYNINSTECTSVYELPLSYVYVTGSFPNVYNIVAQQYLYIYELVGRDTHYYVLVDIENQSINTTPILSYQRPFMLATDLSTNKFYGISRDSTNNSYIIVSIDPICGECTQICSGPSDYRAHLNCQKAVFDSYNGLYLLPYMSTSDTNKLAIIDINNGNLETITFLPTTDYHFINYDPNPILKLKDGKLIGSYSDNYTWYLNDTIIAGAHSQVYIPITTGNYKFSTSNYEGSIVFSNEVYVENINNVNHQNTFNSEFLIYPNPSAGLVNIKRNDIKHNLLTLNILDINGKILNEINMGNRKFFQIDLSDYHNGIYFIKCYTENNIIVKKIIKY